MEEKINIAKILNGKPVNTKLWSPLFGDVYTSSICSEDTIIVVNHHAKSSSFYNNGKYFDHAEAEPLLFPSKEMRDWSKFFKKGDVLICYEGKKPYYTIFDGFEDNTYRAFKGKFAHDCYEDKWYQNEGNLSTNTFQKLNRADSEIYVTKIEERFGGKLNRETLKIEKAQPEFKIGDILFVKYNNRNIIFILSNINGKFYNHRVRLDSDKVIINYRDSHFQNEGIEFIRYATEEEKEQLFDALAKECKGWDSEKKEVVDLKPKCEFKPFDRCIWKIRNCEGSIWQASFVSYVDEYGASPMGMSIDEDLVNLIILPYNDQTKLLVGTTDEWKGGEQ